MKRGRPQRTSVPGLAERLRQRRLDLGWSQEDLGAEFRLRGHPLPRSKISQYELDQITPGPAVLIHLAQALECSLDWLLMAKEPQCIPI